MNLGEIHTRVQRQFGDESGAEITTTDITRWANDALVDLARKTEALQDTHTFLSVAEEDEYALPVDFLSIRRLTMDDTNGNKVLWNKYDAGSLELVSDPNGYYIWGETLFLNRGAYETGRTFRMQYVKLPTALVNVGDVPELPVHMHEDILYYCLARAKELDEEDGQAATMQARYDARSDDSAFRVQHQRSDSFPAVRDYDSEVEYYGP